MGKPKFNNASDQEFMSTLRARVHSYFDEHSISSHANFNMYVKTGFMFLLYFAPFAVVMSGIITNPWLFVLMYVLMGCGIAGIGLSVMHDANHGAYSSNRSINKWMGLSLNIVGGHNELWKLQHNQLHHTYTNIEGHDEDLDAPPFLRFSPHKERLKIHRFQFIYAWFFYALMTLSWISMKEVTQIVRYRKLNLINSDKKFKKLITSLAMWKLFYWSYMFVLPLIILSEPAWFIIGSFVIMHFTAGLILSLIFQSAHIMPECDFPLPDNTDLVEKNWAEHELMTTTNFAQKSRIFSWLIGGLNYQVEHHLFPQVCHVHYPQISKIVASTAAEFGMPYHTSGNFIQAVWKHGKMLYRFGKS